MPKSSSRASRVVILSPACISIGVGGRDFDAEDIPDADLFESAGTGFLDMMLARDPAASELENGRLFGAFVTGLFRMTKGDDMDGNGGTGLPSIRVGPNESGLSLAVVAYVVQLRWLTGSCTI